MAPPGVEGPQIPNNSPVLEGPQSPEKVEYERQETQKEDEKNRAPRGEHVPEQEQESAKPSKEEVEDKLSTTCMVGETTLEDRQQYL